MRLCKIVLLKCSILNSAHSIPLTWKTLKSIICCIIISYILISMVVYTFVKSEILTIFSKKMYYSNALYQDIIRFIIFGKFLEIRLPLLAHLINYVYWRDVCHRGILIDAPLERTLDETWVSCFFSYIQSFLYNFTLLLNINIQNNFNVMSLIIIYRNFKPPWVSTIMCPFLADGTWNRGHNIKLVRIISMHR